MSILADLPDHYDRHRDALFIVDPGACNPSGVALAIHNACRQAIAEGTDQRTDPAIRLMATVAANAVFAAITGISIASAAVFTKVAIPEMLKLGYTARFATGVVAGSSVLGMLIPPSLLLIVYGFLAETSIGALFIAGIIPGLLLSLAFALLIFVLATRFPAFVGAPKVVAGGVTDGGPPVGYLSMAPVVGLIVLVLGGIYGGFFTPTEAGAVGALGALLLALARGRRRAARTSVKDYWRVLIETGHVTVSICFLLIAASIYTRMLGLAGIPQHLVGLVESAELGFAAFIALYVVLILVMGTVLDFTSIMLVVLPLVLPIAQSFGVDLVWFGIVTVIAVEIGLLTPPLGIAVYVIKSTLDDPSVRLGDIFAGAAPFADASVIVSRNTNAPAIMIGEKAAEFIRGGPTPQAKGERSEQ